MTNLYDQILADYRQRRQARRTTWGRFKAGMWALGRVTRTAGSR